MLDVDDVTIKVPCATDLGLGVPAPLVWKAPVVVPSSTSKAVKFVARTGGLGSGNEPIHTSSSMIVGSTD